MLSSPVHAARGVMLAVLLLASPSLSFAQEVGAIPVPVAEVSAGYTFMREFEGNGFSGDHLDFPAGWYVSGAFNVNRWFGVVLESASSYKNDLSFSMPGLTQSSDLRVHTFMAGGRFFRSFGRIAPYGQVLAGVAVLRHETEYSGAFSSRGSNQLNRFALQPGGGVTVYLTDRVGVRVSADLRTIMDFDDETEYTNELRVISGFVFQWGAR
jgi:opacity protein-like surface antigen